MEAGAGDRQGQEAKHPLFHRIQRPDPIAGDGDHKQANAQVHQIGMDGQAVGQAVGAELLQQGLRHSLPSRIASTTGTVCKP